MKVRVAPRRSSASSDASVTLNLAIPFRDYVYVERGEVEVGDRVGDETLEVGGGGDERVEDNVADCSLMR